MKLRPLLAFLMIGGPACIAAADPANTALMVYRIGDGAATLSSAATRVFLEKRATDGALLEVIAMPTAPGAAPLSHALTASGSATSEGLLTRSTDGHSVVLGGYDAAPGIAGVASTAAGTVPRVVAVVSHDGSVDTTTALSDWSSASNPRSVASTDGTNLWVGGGAGGVRFATRGASTSLQLSTAPTNIRGVKIHDGQLYISTASGTQRLATVGIGLPTTNGQAVTRLPGVSTNGSPYQFVLFDLSPSVAGPDTLYVADDSAGILKYSYSGAEWLSGGAIAPGVGHRGLTGAEEGGVVYLYATRATANALVRFVDANGHGGGVGGVSTNVLATPAPNTVYRGVALAPVAPAQPGGYEFYAQQIPDPARRGAEDNADGDPYPNLLEYVTGGNPASADTAARLNGLWNEGRLALVFPRNTNATDATLIVDAADTLTNRPPWTGIATNRKGVWSGAAQVSESGTTSPVRVVVRDVAPAATNRFLRLRVTLP